MEDMTEFQQRACAAAVAKMFRSRHFNICDLDAIAKTMGREASLAGRDYSAMQALHCINWADMDVDLRRMTREKCLELLGLPPQTVETIQPEETGRPGPPEAKAGETPKRLRLAFWRRA